MNLIYHISIMPIDTLVLPNMFGICLKMLNHGSPQIPRGPFFFPEPPASRSAMPHGRKRIWMRCKRTWGMWSLSCGIHPGCHKQLPWLGMVFLYQPTRNADDFFVFKIGFSHITWKYCWSFMRSHQINRYSSKACGFISTIKASPILSTETKRGDIHKHFEL